MSEVVYTYDGSFDGFLSCVFARYANKEVPIAISRDEDFPPDSFPPIRPTPGGCCARF